MGAPNTLTPNTHALQVEEVRNPELQHVPLGVTQKYLIVGMGSGSNRAFGG